MLTFHEHKVHKIGTALLCVKFQSGSELLLLGFSVCPR